MGPQFLQLHNGENKIEVQGFCRDDVHTAGSAQTDDLDQLVTGHQGGRTPPGTGEGQLSAAVDLATQTAQV